MACTDAVETAVAEAEKVIAGAHVEAKSVEKGITLVKLMGRHSGFIAVEATVASQDVNFCLIPEIPFQLHGRRGFLNALKQRILKRSHAVIVVAEGAGQDLLANTGEERDASGNIKLRDIGSFLCGEISDHFKREKIPAVVRCVDPGYIIRSVPASAADMILCDQYARNAVHAAMAGKTGLVIGLLHSRFIHSPVDMLGSHQKRVDPAGPRTWTGPMTTSSFTPAQNPADAIAAPRALPAPVVRQPGLESLHVDPDVRVGLADRVQFALGVHDDARADVHVHPDLPVLL